MKKYQVIGLIAILLFSFFYAKKITDIALESNPLYQSIYNDKDKYTILPVNALVDGDKIIPGLNGIEVNAKKSYYNMRKIESFNESRLVYNILSPSISIDSNKDKIIIRGNRLKNKIAFIIEDNNKIIKYMLSNGIKASILVNINNYNEYANFELINNDKANYDKVEILLNKYKKNVNICYANVNIEQTCRKYKKYLVQTDLIVNNQSFINIKNRVTSGDIYYISPDLTVDNFDLLIKTIKYKDLDIVFVSELISEERD